MVVVVEAVVVVVVEVVGEDDGLIRLTISMIPIYLFVRTMLFSVIPSAVSML